MHKLAILAVLSLPSATALAAPKPAAHSGPRPSARSAPIASLPVFSFMGDDTEHPTTRTALNNSACTTTGVVKDCTDYKDPTLAGTPLKFMWMKFNSGLLYSVYASFGEYGYAPLLAAFEAKYGKPTAIETRKWQSKGGASFDNNVAIWRFKGGELELDSMGLDTSSASFEFTSPANSPPEDKPKVDF